MTVIEIRPHRWGWKSFEAPGVEKSLPFPELGFAVSVEESMKDVHGFARFA
jgi:hypothetical protein